MTDHYHRTREEPPPGLILELEERDATSVEFTSDGHVHIRTYYRTVRDDFPEQLVGPWTCDQETGIMLSPDALLRLIHAFRSQLCHGEAACEVMRQALARGETGTVDKDTTARLFAALATGRCTHCKRKCSA